MGLLKQYNELDELIRSLATQVVDFGANEREARWRIYAEVHDSGLITDCVHWKMLSFDSFLFDDVHQEIDTLVCRMITGGLIGERQRSSARLRAEENARRSAAGRTDLLTELEDANPSLDLAIIAAGASAVGYIRNGISMQITKAIRNVRRRTPLINDVLIPVLIPDVCEGEEVGDEVRPDGLSQATKALKDAEDRRQRSMATSIAERFRHEEILDIAMIAKLRRTEADYLHATALCLFYRVPLPVVDATTHDVAAMVKTLERDDTAALGSMNRALFDRECDDILAGLWQNWSDDHLFAIVSSMMPRETAHAIALGALKAPATRDAHG